MVSLVFLCHPFDIFLCLSKVVNPLCNYDFRCCSLMKSLVLDDKHGVSSFLNVFSFEIIFCTCARVCVYRMTIPWEYVYFDIIKLTYGS